MALLMFIPMGRKSFSLVFEVNFRGRGPLQLSSASYGAIVDSLVELNQRPTPSTVQCCGSTYNLPDLSLDTPYGVNR